jgi:hypothetical protein
MMNAGTRGGASLSEAHALYTIAARAYCCALLSHLCMAAARACYCALCMTVSPCHAAIGYLSAYKLTHLPVLILSCSR